MRLLLIVGIGMLLTAHGHTSITHTVRFKTNGLVIVWEDAPNGTAASSVQAIRGRSVTLTKTVPVHTGQIIPLPIQTAALTSHSEQQIDYKVRFYVASNAAFSIDAELADPSTLDVLSLQNITLNLKTERTGTSALRYGARAQYPHSDGPFGGRDRSAIPLSELVHRTSLFRGNQPTAAERGTISEQSVAFEVTYTQPAESPLRAIPDIVFTIQVL